MVCSKTNIPDGVDHPVWISNTNQRCQRLQFFLFFSTLYLRTIILQYRLISSPRHESSLPICDKITAVNCKWNLYKQLTQNITGLGTFLHIHLTVYSLLRYFSTIIFNLQKCQRPRQIQVDPSAETVCVRDKERERQREIERVNES